MSRHSQSILYHLLPVVAWLLAAGGIVLWELCFDHTTSDSPLSPFNFQFSLFTYLTALLSLAACVVIRHIQRHDDPVEPCFRTALLLGIAACWLPSVLILIIPIWIYLIRHNLFSLRALLATLLGLVTVGIWFAVFAFHFSPFNFQFSIFNFQFSTHLSAWIPTGAVLAAWLVTVITRTTLRVR